MNTVRMIPRDSELIFTSEEERLESFGTVSAVLFDRAEGQCTRGTVRVYVTDGYKKKFIGRYHRKSLHDLARVVLKRDMSNADRWLQEYLK